MTRKKMFLLLQALSWSLVGTTLWGALPKSKPQIRVGYTIVWKGIFYDRSGNAQVAYTESRYVSSRGNFRSVKLYPDGRRWETIAEVGRGVFSIRDGSPTMQYRSPYVGSVVTPKNCARIELVLGYTACVQVSRTGTVMIERYLAFALNGDIIKHVYRDSSLTRILEPISITLGEPPPALLQGKNLPVEYTQYRQILDCRNQGARKNPDSEMFVWSRE